MAERWSEDDDRLLEEFTAAERAEASGQRVWITPDDPDDLDGRVSDRGWRPWLIGGAAVLGLLALGLPILLNVLAALGN